MESARLERAERDGVLICGMGGSAIGGDLAAAALGERLVRPMATVRGYGLPGWATEDWAVVCSSYSGGTEETVACFEAASELGAERLVAGTGGPLVERAREQGVPVIGLPGYCSRGWRSPTCSSSRRRRRRSYVPRRESRPRSRRQPTS